ncbi:hypothetical protein MMC13_002983 [Lambiella insularis]|nr:hypothetical protein [Lambiella insularis]
MFQGSSHKSTRGRPRQNGHIETVPLKGLFADGIWQCNCAPRLPAEHFQTKNGGRNHGRWFYTCQKSQPKRCSFFLWDDDAKPREASAVLANTRSEASPPAPPPATTPTKRPRSPEPITPYTPSKPPRAPAARPAQESTQSPDETFYDWPASDDDPLATAADHATMPPPETPRKAPKTDALSTPGKRRHEEMAYPTPATTHTHTPVHPASGDDVFATPATAPHARALFGPSPAQTPTPQRFHSLPSASPLPSEPASDLAAEILASLRELHVGVSGEAAQAVRGVCARWELKLQGVARGRDVSRRALKVKEARVAELLGRIAGLEAEREGVRAVVGG